MEKSLYKWKNREKSIQTGKQSLETPVKMIMDELLGKKKKVVQVSRLG